MTIAYAIYLFQFLFVQNAERSFKKYPETKQRVFDRLRTCGGVKFYRYLDMSNPVIQYVKENLACEQAERMEE